MCILVYNIVYTSKHSKSPFSDALFIWSTYGSIESLIPWPWPDTWEKTEVLLVYPIMPEAKESAWEIQGRSGLLGMPIPLSRSAGN